MASNKQSFSRGDKQNVASYNICWNSKRKPQVFFITIHPKNLEVSAKQITAVWKRTSNKKLRLMFGHQLRLRQVFLNKAEAKYTSK